jgi:molybdopterin/thiamine biosynthesis adenylyltransferase
MWLAADWQCVVNEVRAEHRRKTGFMSGFDEVVAGLDSRKKRSFLERAKMSWGMPQAEGKQ